MAKPLTAIILAAGEGTRMKSKIPKVLHGLAGKPMLDYALQAAQTSGASRVILVVGAGAEKVAAHAKGRAAAVVQKKRLGTGHAVAQAMPLVKNFSGDLLVLYGDSPLLRPETLAAFLAFHRTHGGAATVLTARVKDPFGYGRVVRDGAGRLQRIVEEKDADEPTRAIQEVNGGAYLFKAAPLREALGALKPQNAKGEYYLPDAVAHLLASGAGAEGFLIPDPEEILGVNDRGQLALAERVLNRRRIEAHQAAGVTFTLPGAVEVAEGVRIGADTVVEGGVHLEGRTVIGVGCRLETGSRLKDARLGRGVTVKSSWISDSVIGEGSDVGPGAHVRGGSVIGPGVHIGTHAELKNARLASGAKVGHFSYVGDATLGQDVNVGAGCVFANFDGKKKHRTAVGKGAFLGSNSTLVAPVSVGAGAVVAAGAVVTRNVGAKTTVAGVPARVLRKTRTN
ncbi:MAG TPA: bifunctional UDP-N-acetylglucosamine diphosphorylase/glucosamine-1-phosphate N-acetyltransferase GlmU [bacterium]|nr:bifunctional UDP-N-acetylglucosamine diphosphorylase/glucosamine-1-phosphate N-acetyltransferase GlmU [bacterium]